MKNWFDHILFHARAQPEKPALVMEDRVVTYGMLHLAIDHCAHRLVVLDIPRDGVVAVLIKNSIRHLTICLALFRIGVVTMSLEHSQSGIRDLRFSAVLADADAGMVLAPGNRIIEVTDAWFTDAAVARNGLPATFHDGAQICRHSLTSGATGAAKLVKHSVEAIGRRIPPFIDFNWNILLCLPGLSSIWGFTTATTVLATGRTLCFAASPHQAIRMIELFSIDFVMASTEQLLALTRVARKSGARVPSLQNIWVGGNVPSRALLEAAMMYLCRNILCRYAGSELGHMAQAPASEVLAHPGLVGQVIPEVEVGIFDSHGGKCPPGQIGMVKARLKDDPTGSLPPAWADLNDLGWMTADDRLYIVGRTTDLATDSPQGLSAPIMSVYEVEQILRLEWDTTDAAAVLIEDSDETTGTQIWIGMVEGKSASADKLATMLRMRGINIPVRLFEMRFIPRGTNGKVNRTELKSMMLKLASQAAQS